MKKYIDAEELKEFAKRYIETGIHAHWITSNITFPPFIKCSFCGTMFDCIDEDDALYCPHCGAKMDEVNKRDM